MPESQTPPAADLGQLRRLLVQHFSPDDLDSLCQDLDVDYDVLPGEGTDAKARELIAFMHRRDRLADLLAAATRERPQGARGNAGENRDRGQGQSPEIDTERRTERPAQTTGPVQTAEAKDESELTAQQKMDVPLPNAQQTAMTSGKAKANVKQEM
jgi:hypothetical protein